MKPARPGPSGLYAELLPAAKVRWLAAALAALSVLPVAASPPLWELTMDRSVVRIAGSLHYLREDDYPLPPILRRAYAEADRVAVEYETASGKPPVDPRVLTRQVPRAGRLKPAGELRRNLSTAEFTALRRLATERGFDVDRLDDLRPWFAGMYVIDRKLEEAGFRSDLGLDNKVLEWAREDGKPVISLESRLEQRRLFNGLSVSEQVEFLMQSLRDAPRMGDAMASVVASWRDGDLESLEASLLDNLKRRPDEYRHFAVDRNRRWRDRLTELPDDGSNYLVIVGTLHLLGDDSLIAQLREQGFKVRRIEKPDEFGSGGVHAGQGR